MASAAVGTPCDAASLKATGPRSAAIPGGMLWVLTLDSYRPQQAPPTPLPGASDSSATQAPGTEAPAATPEPLGEAVVPKVGVVAAQDAGYPYPAACEFTVDVPLAHAARRYGFALAEIYLPVPVATHQMLVDVAWTVTIDVNPQ